MYQIECAKYLKHISFGSPKGDFNISNRNDASNKSGTHLTRDSGEEFCLNNKRSLLWISIIELCYHIGGY